MTWSYRIMRHKTKEGTFYGLHEVIYDGRKKLYTEALDGLYDSPKELIESLEMKLADAKKYRKKILPFT